MSKLGYCGLDCQGCPAFVAHLNDDQELRIRTAEEWSRQHGADIKPEDINCTGCISTGVQFPWCSSECPIRQCAIARQVESCGLCGDYPCETIGFIIDNVPDAREQLDRISSGS
jgi:hypothetical protein